MITDSAAATSHDGGYAGGVSTVERPEHWEMDNPRRNQNSSIEYIIHLQVTILDILVIVRNIGYRIQINVVRPVDDNDGATLYSGLSKQSSC